MLENPVQIHSLPLKNRFYLPPMATRLLGDPLIEYYDKITRPDRMGLIITEHAFVMPSGKANTVQVSVASDEDLPLLRRLTETIHTNGSAAFAQINHAGARAVVEDPGSASPVKNPRDTANDRPVPHEMTVSEIYDVVDAFAAAAVRCQKAGYDGVEIHSAHGYLLNQFYSPLTNHRSDAYGGSVENRVRFHLEVIRAVRAAVGSDYPVIIRLGACDYMEGGNAIPDAVKASQLFEEAGVDAIDISGGLGGYVRPGWEGPASFRDVSLAVREAVSIPVMLTGNIRTREDCENLLAGGEADMIGIGRPLLQDPDCVTKIL